MIDAGGLALSKDRSTAAVPHDVGYGLVVDLACGDSLPALQVARVSQEHGVIASPRGDLPFDALPPGARVRVLPNHACFTAAAYEFYYVVDGGPGAGDEVVAEWPRVNRW